MSGAGGHQKSFEEILLMNVEHIPMTPANHPFSIVGTGFAPVPDAHRADRKETQ